MALSIFAGGIHDMVQRKDLITLSFMIPVACTLHNCTLHNCTHSMTSQILQSTMDILYSMTLDRMLLFKTLP